MQQLPLELSAPPEPDFANFVPGANAEALAGVRALAAGASAEVVVYVWGPLGSGRTHLLRAAARFNPALLTVDDVETLDQAGQQALFGAINSAREGHSRVLAAGAMPPAALALRDDVRTRLAWGLVYHLKGLSDEDKAAYLRAEAGRRGMPLGEEPIRYILSHLPRDFASLNALLDLLDSHSLARQRPVTLALVREALYGPDRR